jgi:hypothetical protein
VRVFSICPFYYEMIVIMPNEHFRHMAAGAVALGNFYRSAQRLLFARELGIDVLAGTSHLPIAILVHHHVPRFVQFVLHLLLRSAQTNNVREPSGFKTRAGLVRLEFEEC